MTRALLTPRNLWYRRRHRNDTPFVRTALDNANYRRSMYDFIAATMEQPNILTNTQLTKDSVVLDVGAFVGRWGSTMARCYGATVYSFELSPHIIPQLQEAAASLPNLHVLEYGLGDSNTTVHLTRRERGSSAFSRGPSDQTAWDECQIRDVTDVWCELDLERVDLMKINIEGGEYDLLERMSATDLLERVDTFQIQFHEWLPRAHVRRRRIRAELSKTHRIVWDYPFVWEKWQHR